MPRERYIKEREDYRSGGRVALARGTRRKKVRIKKTPRKKITGPKRAAPAPTPVVAPVQTPSATIAPPRTAIAPPKEIPVYRDEKTDTGVPAETSVGQTGTPGRNISGEEYEAAKAEAEAARIAGVGGPEPDLSSGTDGSQEFKTGSGAFSPPDQTPTGPPGTPESEDFIPLPPVVEDPPKDVVPPPGLAPDDPFSRDRTRAATEEVLARGKIPDPVEVDTDIRGKETPIADRPDIVPGQAEPVTVGETATGVSAEAREQAPIPAAAYRAKKVSEDVLFDPATGAIREDKDLAYLADKALTISAEGVDFTQEQKDRGVIDRITGTLDPESKAGLVEVAGTTLPRVLRAKKQLRRAGLSEDQIDLMGNDPEALEDELMQYTEAERGMIAGLPDQALVSTQINSLLDGMESGEIPAFAKPAVAAVNQMLAERGLDASTVGRDALFNAIIQAAVPIAQSNAQSIKEAVIQQKGIEAQAEQLNAQMAQQTAISNADKVFNLNMQQFAVDQQTEIANKKFLQTTSLTEVSNDQQATIQNAVHQTQLDLANLSTQERLAVNNAQAFLSMNMKNITNDQQGRVIEAQAEQQRLLSNQSAVNASRQFNSTSENQTNQFMASLNHQIELNNADRIDRMEITNNAAENARIAQQAGIDTDLAKINATLVSDINRFNAQMEFNRDNWNAQNRAAVEQSNVIWRRNANTINTAAANTIAMQNAQNAFGLGSSELSFIWQEARDKANYSFQAIEREKDRKVSLLLKAITAEGEATVQAAASKQSNTQLLFSTAIRAMFGGFNKDKE